MKIKTNIIESVEFLAEEELLVTELDRRLSYTAVGNKGDIGHCGGVSVCNCLIHTPCRCVYHNGVSAVRG